MTRALENRSPATWIGSLPAPEVPNRTIRFIRPDLYQFILQVVTEAGKSCLQSSPGTPDKIRIQRAPLSPVVHARDAEKNVEAIMQSFGFLENQEFNGSLMVHYQHAKTISPCKVGSHHITERIRRSDSRLDPQTPKKLEHQAPGKEHQATGNKRPNDPFLNLPVLKTLFRTWLE